MATKPAAKKKADSKKEPKRTPQDYGFVREFLTDHPQVHRRVKKAVKEGWAKDKLQASIKETSWWRKHSDAQRKADLLSTENPTEYDRQISVMQTEIANQARTMGVALPAAKLHSYATAALRNDYSAAEITGYLAHSGSMSTEDAKGQAAVVIDGIREMAASYGVKVSNATLANQVRAALSSGDPSGFMAGYEDTIREQAKSMYPSIAADLDRGMTVRDRVGSYLEQAGSVLGIDPQTMDMSDPKWTKMLNGPDGQVMSQDQWLGTLRSDQQYGWARTSGAKNEAADFAQQLITLMRGGVGT